MNNSVFDAKQHFETTYAQLQQQKTVIKQMSFGTSAEQITYIKEHYLPLLVDCQLAESIWQFELKFPMGSPEHKKNYINKAHDDLADFFYKHQDLFVHYRNGYTHLDSNIFQLDCSLLETYAKCISAEYLDKYFNNRYEGKINVFNDALLTLTWTNKQVALVELAHALHEVKAFNHGNISISSLVNALSNIFQVKFTQDPNRIWQDIKNRKKRQIYS